MLVVFALYSSSTLSQTVSITSVSFSPNPTSCSTNTISVGVMVGCMNYPYVNTTFNVIGNTIDVNVNYSGGAICLGAIVNATHTSNMPSVGGGTYTVNVKTYLNGGLQASWAPQTWTVTSCGPEADFDLSTTSICIPDSIVATNTSLSSTSYSWFLNGLFISNDTSEVFYPSNPGPNEIMLVASDGLSTDTFTQSVDAFLAAPFLNLGSDTMICEHDSIPLDIGSTYTNIAWSNGDTSSSILAGPGVYSVTISEPETCESSDTINIVAINLDSFHIVSTTSLNCDQATLEATPGFNDYLWSNGGFGNETQVESTGTYSVTATSTEGCSVVDSFYVEVFNSPFVNLGNDTLICTNTTWSLLLDPGVSGSYVWSNGSTQNILGVSGVFGTYWVEVTDNNGCTGTDTIKIEEKDCSSVGLKQTSPVELLFTHPNPVRETINISGDFKYLKARIFDLEGRIVFTASEVRPNLPVLNVQSLSNGLYILELASEKGLQHNRIIIAQ